MKTMKALKAFLKLTPVILLAGLLLGGVDILLSAPLATVWAGILAFVLDRKSYKAIYSSAMENAKNLIDILFLLMISFAMAEVFMASGVGASIIEAAMAIGLTGTTVASASLLVTAILSVATGTSWGTFAACVPVFLWLSHIVGGSPLLTVAAIAGGCCFGDNIGLISDTTVLSSGVHNVEVVDRVRHQGSWSLICLAAGFVVFLVVSGAMGLGGTSGSAAEAIDAIPADVWVTLSEENASAVTLLEQVRTGVPMYLLIPLVAVVIMAVAGLGTVICLGAGILLAFLLGLAAGTLDLSTFGDLVYAGFSDAGSWTVAMTLWTAAFGGIMSSMNAFDPIVRGVSAIVRNVRQLLFCNALLSLFCNAVLGDCTGQIVTMGPIIKDMTEREVEATPEQMYKLRLRNSTYSDAFGTIGSQLIPWHGYMIYFTGLAASVYPLYEFTPIKIISANYFSIIAVVSMLVLTITGWDRFLPGFKVPTEKDGVHLRSQKERAARAEQ